ncbi:MAG: glycosyltransferase family 2 protein [Phycisphaerae bacterium]|nr:glycosyltransferase family 2 protein [Phycisphaerae bacterium]
MLTHRRPEPQTLLQPPRVPTWRVRAVIPSFGREPDLALLLADLARQRLDLAGGIHLHVTLVDNASPSPLSRLHVPPRLDLEHLRLPANTGGSGGFNAGLRLALSRGTPADRCELLWLLDSDARLSPDALAHLVLALAADPSLAAVGSALADPATGLLFEVGGALDPRTGEYRQPTPPHWAQACDFPALIDAEYLAACSLLVRRDAAERAGLLHDLFLSGDDVEWSLRIARRTRLGLAVAPASRAFHPHPDRMRTAVRYYAARNAFVALAASPVNSARLRFRRALRESARAASLALIARDDLARLHLRGLRDASLGLLGPAPAPLLVDPPTPLHHLPAAVLDALSASRRPGRLLLRASALADPAPLLAACQRRCIHPVIDPPAEPPPLRTLLQRLLRRSPYAVAVVSARARPGDWIAARTLVAASPEGFTLRRISRLGRARALLSIALQSLPLAARLALRPPSLPPPEPLVPSPSPSTSLGPPPAAPALPIPVPSLAIVILSFNRADALARTLRSLAANPDAAHASVIVVDNASTDSTLHTLRDHFPHINLIPLPQNRGVEGFNIGVRAASADLVLILDDDAVPAPGVLAAAINHLTLRPDLAAVALHPRHPATGRSEWPFAEHFQPALEPRLANHWPVMGCANLVRRDAWLRVGGYEPDYFLYRNDADLAMKLIGAGLGVRFDPALVALHDSPAASRKSTRWFRLATRNWVWNCRRHGRGLPGLALLLLGLAWALRLAAPRPGLLLRTLRGALEGLSTPPPPLHAPVEPDGSPVRDFLRLRLRRAPR